MNTQTEEELNQYRSLLFSIAYRMLGTIADAEDMVQETFASWMQKDKSHVENMRFYLIKTVSNKCISHLRKLKRQREIYSGTWLPEPLLTPPVDEQLQDFNKDLSIGFMYLLEKLTPAERGTFILKEAFDLKHSEIARIFNISSETCRQHLSRAKKKTMERRKRFPADINQHKEILQKFLDACLSRDLEALIKLLSDDVTVYGDGGGNSRAIKKPLSGKKAVLKVLFAGAENSASFSKKEILFLNGSGVAAFYMDLQHTTPSVLVAIDADEKNEIYNIYFMGNPEKLRHISRG